MTSATNASRLTFQIELGNLGERLIRLGQALQNPETTVGQLTSLAKSCGIALNLRTVADSEDQIRCFE